MKKDDLRVTDSWAEEMSEMASDDFDDGPDHEREVAAAQQRENLQEEVPLEIEEFHERVRAGSVSSIVAVREYFPDMSVNEARDYVRDHRLAQTEYDRLRAERERDQMKKEIESLWDQGRDEEANDLAEQLWMEEMSEIERKVRQVVVTRHPALVEYLVEIGLTEPGSPVITHADADDVKGKHVIGVLPLRLAVEAASVTEVEMHLRPDQRGRELSLDEVRAAAGGVTTYVVSTEEDIAELREEIKRLNLDAER